MPPMRLTLMGLEFRGLRPARTSGQDGGAKSETILADFFALPRLVQKEFLHLVWWWYNGGAQTFWKAYFNGRLGLI